MWKDWLKMPEKEYETTQLGESVIFCSCRKPMSNNRVPPLPLIRVPINHHRRQSWDQGHHGSGLLVINVRIVFLFLEYFIM